MKVSLNWIKEFTKITLPPKELKDVISVSLTEAENIENFGEKYSGIIVAKVLEVQKHPKSDGLLVLKLDVGDLTKTVVIQVCPVKVGDKVPYLKPGTVIPESVLAGGKGIKVEKTKIKEVESEGMIPSGREMALNYDHTTVYTVSGELKPGEDISQSLDLVDQILEIKNKSLTNRPDTFSIIGMARELAAMQREKFQDIDWLGKPELIKPEVPNEERLPIKVVNNAKALCRRYIAVVLDDIKIQDSPSWMQIRLSKHGIHPVNNIVDITNYLMLLTGQPSHAFDYDTIKSKDTVLKGDVTINVRLGKPGEKITTIDEQVKDLYDDTVVIADSSNPIGIAGVMGGKDTEISDLTTRVIFQVENLDMYNVRKTSMKTGLMTDAVTRFSKGLDPNRCESVLYKGIQMMQELCNAKIASKIYDYYEEKIESRFLTVSTDKIRKRLGVEIKNDEIKDILERLGITVKTGSNEDEFILEIPTYRPDLRIPQDIDEEVIRIYGYNKIVPKLPMRSIAPVTVDREPENRKRIRRVFKSIGANELFIYSFTGPDLYNMCNLTLNNCHQLKNPLSPALSYMKPVLLPSILEKIPQNVKTKPELACFEIDIINPMKSADEDVKVNLPAEYWHLGLVHSLSYYHAKLYLDTLMNNLGVLDYNLILPSNISKDKVMDWIKFEMPLFNASRTGLIKVADQIIGLIGEINPFTISKLGLPAHTSGFEIRLDDFDFAIPDIPRYKNPSKYPEVIHDFSLVTDVDVPYDAIVDAIKFADSDSKLISDISCIDIYQDNKNKNNKKTTLRISFQGENKTLKDDDIEAIRSDILKSVKKRVGGVLVS
ncbi:phenylalanine--tRNA ligase subunit beta [Candidatus Dojkabacteria bacterium]|nr:phenylalanine--tRNA ligase subunit beta [Candidatus Dojkabacteria bacterium]